MNEWPLQDAKNKFSALVNAALAGEPQLVTRRGRPAVVVLAADEYERLRRLDRADAPALDELLTQIPQDDQDFERISVPARPFSWLVLPSKKEAGPRYAVTSLCFQCVAMAQDSSSLRRYVRVHFADSQVPASKNMPRRLSEQLPPSSRRCADGAPG